MATSPLDTTCLPSPPTGSTRHVIRYGRSRPGLERTGRSCPTLLTDRAVVVSGLLAASSRRADTDQAAGDVATLTDAWSITARRVDALERMDARIREIDRIELDRVERAVVDDLVSARHPREAAQ